MTAIERPTRERGRGPSFSGALETRASLSFCERREFRITRALCGFCAQAKYLVVRFGLYPLLWRQVRPLVLLFFQEHAPTQDT